MEREVIINRLLRKYEKSAHFSKQNASNKRVMLKIPKRELPEYEYEKAIVRDSFNSAAIELEKEGVVKIHWGIDKSVMSMIVLVLDLDKINLSYEIVGSVHPIVNCAMLKDTLSDILPNPRIPWVMAWRDSIISKIEGKPAIPSSLNQDIVFALEFVKMLAHIDSLNGQPISIRAFSTLCFQNSKRFENGFQSGFLREARRFVTEISDVYEQEGLGDREALTLMGLYSHPEMYLISGRCKIHTKKGTVDFAAFYPHGFTISETLLNDIESFGLESISKVTFIENLTNYHEYIRAEIIPEELVVYHGGFLSPRKRALLSKITNCTLPDTEVFFWADIDMGGFQMFSRLQEMIPNVRPMRMSADDVINKAKSGLIRDEAYLERLKLALAKNVFPAFTDTIAKIIEFGVTIEQEAFL